MISTKVQYAIPELTHRTTLQSLVKCGYDKW